MKKIAISIITLFAAFSLFSAVEFLNFTADIGDMEVVLEWSTATETANVGFILERKTDSLAAWNPFVSYLDVDALLGQGTVTYQTDYSFTDTTVTPGIYYYRISGVDNASVIGVLDSLSITVSETAIQTSVPHEFDLKCYPNPFNPRIAISFSISGKTSMDRWLLGNNRVKALIYNSNGGIVKKLLDAKMSTGAYEIIWDASNVPSGVFVIMVQAGEFMNSQKIVLVK